MASVVGLGNQESSTSTKAKGAQPVNVGTGTNWATALLELLGAPLTAANYRFLNAWATREHGSSYPASLYANNPFFTSAGGSGSAGPFKKNMFPLIPGKAFSSGVNSAGIPAYPDITTGVVATADTLESGYQGIIAALQSGNPEQYANNPTFQKELATWSGSGYSGLNVAGQPGVPEGPKLGVPIEGKSAADITSIGAGGIASAAGGAVSDAAGAVANATGLSGALSFLGKLTDPKLWVRGGEMLGGGVLVLLGLIMLGKGAASSAPAQQTAEAAGTAATPAVKTVRVVQTARAERRYQAGTRNVGTSRSKRDPQAFVKKTPTGIESRPKRRKAAASDDIPF